MTKSGVGVPARTFIVDCDFCKAKVAAVEKGRAERGGVYDGEPYAERLYVGECPSCRSLIAGHSTQVRFEGYDNEEDVWADIVRVYPKPPKVFSSHRIPKSVTVSLLQAERSLQANANIAACAMFGRALEALCRHMISLTDGDAEAKAINKKSDSKRNIMLGEGIDLLFKQKIIDGRLHDWSQQLKAIRNLAAHPDDADISREDAEDMQIFVHAIVEYIYDLTERYNEFKGRTDGPIKRRV